VRTATLALPLACAGLTVAVVFYLQRDPDPDATAAATLLDEYCIGCHNDIDFAGSLRLDDKHLEDVGSDAATWEHVVRKLKTGMMPPAGEPRPERTRLERLTAALESRLDAAAAAHPTYEATALRRLNRTEYGNAIRDLLHLTVDASTLLPLDDSSDGFDNIATALSVSPSLVESYVSAAMKLSRLALGDRTTPQTQVSYAAPQRLAQDRHLAGLPLGTRGGLRIEHLFPLDAEYELRIRRGFRFPQSARLDVTLDGEPLEVEDPANFRIPITAGPHTLTAAIVDTRRPAGVDEVYAEFDTNGAIDSIEVDGPLDPSGVGDTPSRRRVLTCEPGDEAEERTCAEDIVSTLATRAFRRPLSPEDLAPLMAFYQAGRDDGGFEAGIQQALSRILVDPRFLYRIEDEPATAAPGTAFAVDDFELATRLSFFLWSTLPDDALLATAASGRLHEPEILEAEVRRMLADPKADALVENFAAQWLFLRELDSVTPDAAAFDENLRRAMARETKLLFGTVMREDLSLLRLLDADFTFVDERLAEHYGMADVFGSHFRRVALPADSPRRGLLGHASILTVTSVTNRTSPVIRGAWILEALLGSPAPVPPPNVETTLEGDDGAIVTASVRERLEAHRANPTCASCHAIMDPVGFSLENFDLIGAWRDTDGGRPIDTHATLTDGTVIDGPAALRDALLDRSDAFVETAAERLLTYALGRRLEHYDMPTVRAIVRDAEAEDYRFSALVLGIVGSEPFRTRVTGAN
jgi:hypothetical protein